MQEGQGLWGLVLGMWWLARGRKGGAVTLSLIRGLAPRSVCSSPPSRTSLCVSIRLTHTAAELWVGLCYDE